MDEIVKLVDVHKSFVGNKVLRGISFSVKRGETLTIVGKSGAGKTVLLKTIVGLERVDRGKIFLFGLDSTKLKRRELLKLRENIGFVFQSSALFDSMTVFENIAYPFLVKDVDFNMVEEKVMYYLDKVGLSTFADSTPSELSGGMKKRVAIARALVTEPKLILYDEPSAGLDVATGEAISDLIERLNEEKEVTTIIVTHDLDLARRLSDRVLFLSKGVIAHEFRRDEFETKDFSEIAKIFLNKEVG
ncbi:MAG: ATP-binding cassette domain-containing protein [candidate division WOR-3 bacterium]